MRLKRVSLLKVRLDLVSQTWVVIQIAQCVFHITGVSVSYHLKLPAMWSGFRTCSPRHSEPEQTCATLPQADLRKSCGSESTCWFLQMESRLRLCEDHLEAFTASFTHHCRFRARPLGDRCYRLALQYSCPRTRHQCLPVTSALL